MFNLIISSLTLFWIIYCLVKTFKSIKEEYTSKEIKIIIVSALLGVTIVLGINEFIDVVTGLTDLFIGG